MSKPAPARAIDDLIDIGANLTASAFKDDLSEVIDRALTSGVSQMIVTGTSLEHSQRAIELCKLNIDILYSTAGVHPHHASEWSDKVSHQLYNLLDHTSVRAIGECGLDYNRNFSTPEDQRHCFEAQLELAADKQLPVFLHQRDAHDDFVSILSRWRDRLAGGVAHCFTGTAEQAAAYLDLDLHIGVTGWVCDERRGQALQQALRHIPLSCLMIETDAPYLLPRDLPTALRQQLKDRRNEPMLLSHVCQAVAHYMDEDIHQVARQTTQQARQFFAIER